MSSSRQITSNNTDVERTVPYGQKTGRLLTNLHFSFPTTNLEIHRTIGFIDPKVHLETDDKNKETEDMTQLTITLRMTQMAGQFEILQSKQAVLVYLSNALF